MRKRKQFVCYTFFWDRVTDAAINLKIGVHGRTKDVTESLEIIFKFESQIVAKVHFSKERSSEIMVAALCCFFLANKALQRHPEGHIVSMYSIYSVFC